MQVDLLCAGCGLLLMCGDDIKTTLASNTGSWGLQPPQAASQPSIHTPHTSCPRGTVCTHTLMCCPCWPHVPAHSSLIRLRAARAQDHLLQCACRHHSWHRQQKPWPLAICDSAVLMLINVVDAACVGLLVGGKCDSF